MLKNNIFTKAIQTGTGVTLANNLTSATNPEFMNPTTGDYCSSQPARQSMRAN